MLEVHVLDAWLSAGARQGEAYHALRWLGGLAAPGFLYMAGVSLALADVGFAARGASPRERRLAGVRRGLWLVGVAFVFRLAEYLLGWGFFVPGGWSQILKVDILNVIGAALVLASLLVARPRWLTLGAAALLVGLAPLAATWPEWALAGGYLSAPGGQGFGLLGWAGFLFAGLWLAPLLAKDRPAWTLLAGAVVWATGLAWERLIPRYGAGDYWLTSPAWFLVRLAATVTLTGLLQLLVRAGPRLQPLAVLGRHSLFAYMLSVELTFGLLLRRFHGALSLSQAVLGIAGMTVAVGLIVWGWRLVLHRRRPAL